MPTPKKTMPTVMTRYFMKHKKNGLLREITENEYIENRKKVPFVNNWDFYEEKTDVRNAEEVISDQQNEIAELLKEKQVNRKQKAKNN